MHPRTAFLRYCVAVGLALGAVVRVEAQLAANSPFLPPQTNAPTTPVANEPLEFSGLMSAPDGGILYRIIYDKVNKKGAFVKLNERKPDLNLLAKQYDAANKTITVEYEGRTLNLPLRESKVLSGGAMPVMPQPMPAPVGSNVPPAVTQAVALNPTPAQEQGRLEAVAQEVARRRALRDQASQQANPGVATPTPPAGAPPSAPAAQPIQPPQSAPPAGAMQQR
ncbi:MAG: hypothetical protein ABIZ49_06155 [Opitutaceae bacterium]